MKFSSSRLSLQLGLSMVAAGFALGVCTSAQAQWKWRDTNNRVQYSDLPPPSTVPESAILQRPVGARRSSGPQFAPAAPSAPAAAEAASGPARTSDPELEAKRKKAEQDQAAARKAEEDKVNAAKAENCTRAKSYLKAIDEGQRMARTNAKGEREVYDDKIRAEESKRTRDIIASDCK
jgi:type IV secretory pathway VirB10-like protein